MLVVVINLDCQLDCIEKFLEHTSGCVCEGAPENIKWRDLPCMCWQCPRGWGPRWNKRETERHSFSASWLPRFELLYSATSSLADGLTLGLWAKEIFKLFCSGILSQQQSLTHTLSTEICVSNGSSRNRTNMISLSLSLSAHIDR